MKLASVIAALCLSAGGLNPGVASATTFPPSCWILSGLKGYGLYKADGYKWRDDGFKNAITLILNGDSSTASGDNIPLMQVARYMAVGLSTGDQFTTYESYLVDPGSETAFLTKALVAGPAYDGMTGARMYKGKARKC